MKTRLRPALALGLLPAAAIALGACGGSKTATTESPAAQSVSQSAAPTGAPAADGLSGEDFLARAAGLSGSTVTLQRCSLLTTPGSDGTLACRVLDKAGKDISDANGLPVDVFVRQADLSPDAQAVVAGCSGMCTVTITGKLDRATDGTGYLSMTDVTLKAAD